MNMFFLITKTLFVSLFGHSPELSVAVLLSLAELSVNVTEWRYVI